MQKCLENTFTKPCRIRSDNEVRVGQFENATF